MKAMSCRVTHIKLWVIEIYIVLSHKIQLLIIYNFIWVIYGHYHFAHPPTPSHSFPAIFKLRPTPTHFFKFKDPLPPIFLTLKTHTPTHFFNFKDPLPPIFLTKDPIFVFENFEVTKTVIF